MVVHTMVAAGGLAGSTTDPSMGTACVVVPTHGRLSGELGDFWGGGGGG
jgi:hypothetical protein